MSGIVDVRSSLDVGFAFERRPEPLSANLRPERRIPLLLLMIAKGHASGASWKALHVLSWALRHPDHLELLLAVRAGEGRPDRPLVRIEPALDRTIDLALGLQLIGAKERRTYKLTEDGWAMPGCKELKQSRAGARGP